ncbi:MAG: metallophosphoesterase [Planctomycetota bacterium]
MSHSQDRIRLDSGCSDGGHSLPKGSDASRLRIAWLTDLHLDHVDMASWYALIERIAATQATHLVVTGDISEGDDVPFQLQRLATDTALPIWFVLGNHDFYQGSIARQREAIRSLCDADERLGFLTTSLPVWITNSVALIGEDGWGDGVVGDYDNSFVRLNDFLRIHDFREVPKTRWKRKLRQLGQESAARLQQKLASVVDSARHVVVATHVPPFSEACWYEGKTADANWAPFFVCGGVGDRLREFAIKHPTIQVTVLCGHSHHPGVAQIRDNLVVYTGEAIYGRPSLAGLLTMDVNGVQCKPWDERLQA